MGEDPGGTDERPVVLTEHKGGDYKTLTANEGRSLEYYTALRGLL